MVGLQSVPGSTGKCVTCQSMQNIKPSGPKCSCNQYIFLRKGLLILFVLACCALVLLCCVFLFPCKAKRTSCVLRKVLYKRCQLSVQCGGACSGCRFLSDNVVLLVEADIQIFLCMIYLYIHYLYLSLLPRLLCQISHHL